MPKKGMNKRDQYNNQESSCVLFGSIKIFETKFNILCNIRWMRQCKIGKIMGEGFCKLVSHVQKVVFVRILNQFVFC